MLKINFFITFYTLTPSLRGQFFGRIFKIPLYVETESTLPLSYFWV